MQISKHKVVSINYRLTDDQGTLIDSSEGEDPLVYLHGVGALVVGLEAALEGKEIGDDLEVSLTPAEAYGDRQEQLRTTVSKDHFEDVPDLEVGMQFVLPADDEGNEEAGEDDQFVFVTAIGDETVTLDGNHPLAGINLIFNVSVVDVRDATNDEISHGHAHGPDDSHE